MRRHLGTAGLFAAVACSVLNAHASPLYTYFGQDLNAGTIPASFDGTLLARDAFVSDVGPVALEGFESLPTGDGLTIGARPPIESPIGMRISVDNAVAEVWHFALGGRYAFDGENYLLFVGKPSQVSSLVLDFARPAHAFGFHATDTGDFAEQISLRVFLADGTSDVLAIPHRTDDFDANASALFFGVRSEVPIARVSIENQAISDGTPYIAFDDFMVNAAIPAGSAPSTPALPNPSTLLLLGAGAFAYLVKKRRRVAKAAL